MRFSVFRYITRYNPFILLYFFLNRVFWSGLNGRNIFQLILNFWINFSPVFIWLLIFKNAGLIPKKIRPPIFVKIAMHMDDYIFNIRSHFILATVSVIVLFSFAFLLYLKFYRAQWSLLGKNCLVLESSSPGSSVDLSDSLNVFSDLEDLDYTYELDNIEASDDDESKQITFVENSSSLDERNPFMRREMEAILKSGVCKPLNCWYLAPPILCASSWFLLNIDHLVIKQIDSKKDIFAWVLYVIAHLLSPIITAVWLYIFHAPGAVKLFSFGLGMQNIAGVLTHLTFPTAPPWFIEKYGENKEANYDMPGYAAGLTRVDIALGTHLHSNGFHASPIVFGAIPSLHSAMAVMAFFFMCYYSRWTITKLFGLSFIACQWWATMYLSHHWRLDLLVGMFYSIISFTLLFLWKRGLRKVDEDFVKARLKFDFKHGSTMGMRVFRNTKIQSFFDPLS